MKKFLKNISLVSIKILVLIPIQTLALEDKVEHLESFRECSYKDANNWAIGFGQQYVQGKRVIKGQCITYNEALLDLSNKIIELNSKLNKWLLINKVKLNRNQKDAIILFVYNIGWSGFLNSTVSEALKTNKQQVPEKLKQYVYSNGRLLKGLVDRRNYEANLFKGIK